MPVELVQSRTTHQLGSVLQLIPVGFLDFSEPVKSIVE